MKERCPIPSERWPDCLEQFSRAHTGRATSVCTSGPPVGGAANAEQLPLIGITAENAGAEVHVMLGRPGGPHVDHVIERPSRLWTAEWNDGFSAELEIDAEDGSTTLVQVGPPEQMLAEGMVVDGVPPQL